MATPQFKKALMRGLYAYMNDVQSVEDKEWYLAVDHKQRFEEIFDDVTNTIKKKKDPDAPKRAKSAFLFFTIENRSAVVEEYPGVSFGDLGKKMGLMWGVLSDDEKKKYQRMADKDKKRYAKEKKAWEVDLE